MDSTGLIGYYHEHGYNICKMNAGGTVGDPLYEAGNSPWESTSLVPIQVGECLPTIKRYCNITGKEMSEETGIPWLGCDREEDPYGFLEDDLAEN